MRPDPPPLVMHVVHAFQVGGLENGVVNLVNRMPEHAYRHMIVSLTDIGGIRQRLDRADVRCIALDKGPGHGAWCYPRMHGLMRRYRPAIVHTRNLAALEMTVPAFAARVPVRIHGEHGRDVGDLDGTSRRHRLVRRLYRPFVNHYIALSRDLSNYLTRDVGIPHSRVTHVYNGVDTLHFAPGRVQTGRSGPFGDSRLFVFGWLGRMAAVKNPLLLARAFVRMRQQDLATAHARLVVAGDGMLRDAIRQVFADAELEQDVWMPGERDDPHEVLRSLDCFVLPSLGEGISNTILEAMATELPVIATQVGGNPELVVDGVTGQLVPSNDLDALVAAMRRAVRDRGWAREAGKAGRQRVLAEFSLDAMVRRYQAIYDASLRATSGRARHTLPLDETSERV
jgi:sugar transferase (PEP-CTERM/EpsH1 system associated)